MVKLTPDMKVVCICRKGQVRSVAARRVLTKMGFFKVLVCGWENNDIGTVEMLCEWADAILVVGSTKEWAAFGPIWKIHRLDVGPDVWGRFDHPDLQDKLKPLIKGLLKNEDS